MIQFLLNQDLIHLDEFNADTTLLDFLRLEKKLTGSKEGCASGDCGACTVVVASSNKKGSDLEYKSLNSCIYLIGSLHGKQVLTVDGLHKTTKKEGGVLSTTLHPVQQAMVDVHASQCGFCTPGFVMSLLSMTKNKCLAKREVVAEQIDGNLCRCTGYRPITDAGLSILNKSFTDHFDKNSPKTLELLQSIKRAKKNDFYIPDNIDELAKLIGENPDFSLLAGGTDLVLDITQGLKKLDKIIYLGNVKELKQIEVDDDQIKLGAAVTYHECEEILVNEYSTLQTHLQRLGSTQIRNVGTVGGNIVNASPIGDMPPVLVALDCTLVLQREKSTRKVNISDFYTAYKQTIMQQGEFLREIVIPKTLINHHLKVYKISKRYADDISAICAAFYIHLEGENIIHARIAMGGMAATVKRALNCEKAMQGAQLDQQTLANAKMAMLSDFEPLNDVRASKQYRLLMAQNLLERLFAELRDQSND